MDSGNEHDTPVSQKRKKRYHRHTPRQIQELESMFRAYPHPDEKQRMQLSRDLGLDPRQIKFWFQNRRTQMKAHHERADNCALRSENDKIRSENIAIHLALKRAICPNCSVPPPAEDSYFEEQKLRMENARLKEELDQVSSITSKYLGRPITRLAPVHPIPISSLDLSIGSFHGSRGFTSPGLGSSINLDLLPGPSASSVMSFPLSTPVTEVEKTVMVEIATCSIEELIRLGQTDEPLWMKNGSEVEVLNLETYGTMFLRQTEGMRIEASRDSGLVSMSAMALVDMFLDLGKWLEFFPTIISSARTIEVLTNGTSGSRSGSLLLMHEELQVLSPVVPMREFCFLRCCQQIEPSLWVIADVSVDIPRDNQLVYSPRARKLPSGCLIQDMANGYSKIIWVEHLEVEDSRLTHRLNRDLIHSGTEFGANRWLSALQRMCERLEHVMLVGNSAVEFRGGVLSPYGKRSMMKLSQKMVSDFCSSLRASNSQQWITLSGSNEVGVRVSVQKSNDLGHLNGIILSAATSIWLPFTSQKIFNFLRDERSRTQWDVLSNGNPVQEVTSIASGTHEANCISLLRALDHSQNNMLILQESCTDAWGSLIIYSPIDLPSFNAILTGTEPSDIQLLPSGFTIVPNSPPGDGGEASTSSNPTGISSGSLITMAFQILVSSLPSSKLNIESVSSVNHLINSTMQQIKAALNCPSF